MARDAVSELRSQREKMARQTIRHSLERVTSAMLLVRMYQGVAGLEERPVRAVFHCEPTERRTREFGVVLGDDTRGAVIGHDICHVIFPTLTALFWGHDQHVPQAVYSEQRDSVLAIIERRKY